MKPTMNLRFVERLDISAPYGIRRVLQQEWTAVSGPAPLPPDEWRDVPCIPETVDDGHGTS